MNKNPQPPSFLLRFFCWFCHPDLLPYIEGDLIELFEERVRKKGVRKAKWLFAWDVVKLFRPGIIRPAGGAYRLNHYGLFLHYLKMVIRGFSRDKIYTSINVFGLAVGMAASLLIYQYIQTELSYDQFHERPENLYRIVQSVSPSGENIVYKPLTWSGLGDEARNSLPEIEELVRIHAVSSLGADALVVTNSENESHFFEKDVLYVDKGFFEIFDFPFENGGGPDVFENPNSVVITEDVATRYFGTTDARGKVLSVFAGSVSGDFVVTGVLKNVPKNTHLKFDILLPMDYLIGHFGMYVSSDGWKWANFPTYIKLAPSANVEAVERGLTLLATNRLGEELENEKIRIDLQPISAIHLRSDLASEYGWNQGDIQNIWILSIVGVVLLLVAWINYINLATARSMRRAREVGVKKTMGANQQQLIVQFLLESFLIHIVSISLALCIALLTSPLIGIMLGTELALELFKDLDFWLVLLLLLIIGSFLAGLYPAVILSRFRPATMLKSAIVSPSGGFTLRRGLIFFQFLISMLLISGTYLVYQQISYMKDQELGVDIERMLVVTGPIMVVSAGQEGLKSKHQLYKNELLKNPRITGITGSSNIPSKGTLWSGAIRTLGAPADDSKEGDVILVDSDFTNAYDFEFLAGKPFEAGMWDYEAVIINEKAVKAFDLESPIDAIGQSLVMENVDTMRIQGVVKDYHWNSLKEPLVPVVLAVVDGHNAFLSIRLNTSNVSETLEYVEASFKKYYPNDPFECYFLDDQFNQQYQADIQFGKVFSLFSALTIFIACIGLFALISFSVTLKVKEMGIRKVLGAGTGNLMLLLSKEYLALLFVAILIAVPVVIIAAREWLENFAYRMDVTPGLVCVPAMILLVIATSTVFHRIFVVANSNPVNALRDE